MNVISSNQRRSSARAEKIWGIDPEKGFSLPGCQPAASRQDKIKSFPKAVLGSSRWVLFEGFPASRARDFEQSSQVPCQQFFRPIGPGSVKDETVRGKCRDSHPFSSETFHDFDADQASKKKHVSRFQGSGQPVWLFAGLQADQAIGTQYRNPGVLGPEAGNID